MVRRDRLEYDVESDSESEDESEDESEGSLVMTLMRSEHGLAWQSGLSRYCHTRSFTSSRKRYILSDPGLHQPSRNS